jgi:hypothetical protein
MTARVTVTSNGSRPSRRIAADLAAHFLHRFRQAETLNRFAVEMADQIAWFEAGPERGCVVDWRDDFYKAVFHRHFNAQSAEFTPGLDLHVAKILGAEVAGMGVQRCQHAVNGCFDQIFIGNFLDVIRAYTFEDVAEQVQLPVGFRIVLLRRQRCGQCDCAR